MYSVVLMMAMVGGGDMPAAHGCCGCCGGCHGCCGGRMGHGCCGGGCHGCCGGGCHGCCGGGHKSKCHGCCGGCYGCCGGYGCCGCYGGYGCCGGGCYGGGCYGGACYGGACYGGAGYGCPGGVIQGAPVQSAPVVVPSGTDKKSTGVDSPAPATIIVSVPADARLTIDGAATTSTSTQRVFVSPELNPGREYHYTLKAEFQKDGKTVTVTKEVAVRAGNETRVALEAANMTGVVSR